MGGKIALNKQQWRANAGPNVDFNGPALLSVALAGASAGLHIPTTTLKLT